MNHGSAGPLVADRAIPIYLGLAEFLAHLEVPRRAGRGNREQGPMHGIRRALLIQQLHHRLTDSPPEYSDRLSVVEGQTYFTASWGEWQRFEAPCFSATTIRLEFRMLKDAGYVVLARTADPEGRPALSINYELLARDMEADERFRTLAASVFSIKEALDPADQGDPPDQPPPDPPDQPPPDPPDQGITESESTEDQTQSKDSSSPNPLLQPRETAFPNGGDEAGDEIHDADPLDQRIAAYDAAYSLLTSQGIHEKVATKLAATCSPQLVQSWIDAKDIALRPKRQGGLGARSWTGFLITVLEGGQQAPPVVRRFLPEEHYAREIRAMQQEDS